MPYLIEKSCGTRTRVEMTAEEAAYKAQSVRIIEITEEGVVIGDVASSLEAEGDAGAQPEAKPARKTAATVKK